MWTSVIDSLVRAAPELLDQDFTYSAGQLDRDVVAEDQIRTVIRTFKEKLFTEIFPGRTHVPKTLIFAKNDNHADDIVQIVREEFSKGNDFCQKVTYRTGSKRTKRKVRTEDGSEMEQDVWEQSGEKAESIIQAFRNSYNPRVAVTVDMISTGTDIRPLEIVMFLRDVGSPNLFEQMKGRGVRVIKADDLQSVTPDVVDAVGVCEHAMIEAPPLDRNRTVGFEKLIESVGFGSIDPDILSSLASRLTRLDRQLSQEDQKQIATLTSGTNLADMVRDLANSVDPDVQLDEAKAEHGVEQPTPDQLASTGARLRKEAAKAFLDPKLRNLLTSLKSSYEQTIDIVSQDQLLQAAFSGDSREKAQELTRSFRQFLEENKHQITALEILYSRPWKNRLTYKEVKELASAIQRPHPAWTPETLWRAYEQLDQSRVRGSGARVMTDLVSLVNFAIGNESSLRPFPDEVRERFQAWLSEQEQLGAHFTDEQLQWLHHIAEHIATSLEIHADDFELIPFVDHGGLGKAYQLFGNRLETILNQLNERLVQ
jgi:type I restriction enzyme R subunit